MGATTDSTAQNDKRVGHSSYPSPSKLAHVVLRSTPENYQAMINFYLKLLNAEISAEGPVITFLRYDDEHHRIAVLCVPEAVREQDGVIRTGLDHIAFTFPTLTDLAYTYTGLRDLETPIKPVWAVNHGPTTSFYYRDPERNKVEFQVDNFDNAEDASAFMSGEYFQENPIGSDFDADKWAAYILGKAKSDGSEGLTGPEVKELKKRVEVGERKYVPDNFY